MPADLRPIPAPPPTEEERLSALREAVERLNTDPDLRRRGVRLRVDVERFLEPYPA